MLFQPIETKRASEVIVDQVLALIKEGELKPGDRLPSEKKMMEMFQRSRPTVREALRMLERAGFIRTSGGSAGALVLVPDSRDMENYMTDALTLGQVSLTELGEYRLVSEVEAAGWAAQRRTDEDVARMEALLAEMEAQLVNTERYTEMDAQLHALIAHAAKNKVAEIFNRTFSKLNGSFTLKRQRDFTPEENLNANRRVHEMHLRIFEAIRDGDVKRAKEEMRFHLEAFLEDLK